MKTTILIIVSLIVFFSRPTFDYRDAYCGDYSCTRLFQHLNATNTNITCDTSTVVITVEKNGKDSILNVIIPEGVMLVKLLDKKFIPINNSRCGGKFKNDSLFLKYTPSAGPQFWRYFGKKNK